MRILGIETSCDETAVCLIEATGSFDSNFEFRVLGNALHSQIATHAPYGGVFPNLAKREHAKNLVPLLAGVLSQVKMFDLVGRTLESAVDLAFDVRPTRSNIKDVLAREPELFEALEEFFSTHGRPEIDAIAVTHGPGLEPALWIGVNFAKALSLVWSVPIVAVNHLEGHITMAAMDMFDLRGRTFSGHVQKFEFPVIAILISGGHTELHLMPRWMEYKMLGETRDDAVGEAFDKVARMMGLLYPGGPEIAKLAAAARRPGADAPHYKLPRPMLNDDSYDFSFSGLKTAVRNLIGGRLPGQGMLTDTEKMEIAREFEDAAADVLVAKTARAAEEYGARTVLVGGGVSANTHIKQRFKTALAEQDVQLLIPPPEWATDNALMIALAGYFHAIKNPPTGGFVDPDMLRADGNLRLGQKI